MAQLDLYKIILDDFNKNILIYQEGLSVYFSKARMLIFEAVNTLIRESTVVQERFANTAFDQTIGLDHGRMLFKRSIETNGNYKKFAHKRFLEHAIDLLDFLTVADSDSQVDIINDSHVSRGEFEAILQEFNKETKDYLAAHDTALQKQALGQSIRLEIEVMSRIEDYFGLRHDAAYGVIRLVSARLDSVKSLYEDVFNSYARLLIGVANHVGKKDNKLDSVQDGAPGLSYAISYYDHNAKSSLSTFAKWWIRQRAFYQMKLNLNTIKPSLNVWQQNLRYEKMKRIHEAKYGSLMSNEIPTGVDITPQQLDSIKRHMSIMQITSLDSLLHQDSNSEDGSSLTMQSCLGNEDVQAEYDLEEENKATVVDLLEQCDPITRKVLCLRFGLMEYLDQQEVPKKEVLKERIRQLVAINLKE